VNRTKYTIEDKADLFVDGKRIEDGVSNIEFPIKAELFADESAVDADTSADA
jgi:hypothetical protein